MPPLLESLYKFTVRKRYATIARDQTDPVAAQERAYQRVRTALQGTEVAKLTGLSAASDLRAFAANVEPHDYAWFKPLVERVVDHGEPSVLFHGAPGLIGLSSGTSGTGEKRVVHSKSTRKSFDAYEMAFARILLSQTPFNPFIHNRLSWGAVAPITRTARGVEQGYICGFMAENPNWVVKNRTFPRDEASHTGVDMKAKIKAVAPDLRTRQIHLLSGVPSYLLNVIEGLRDLWGVADLSSIWPDLNVVCYGGTPIDPYRAQITKVIGHRVHFLGMYVATEGPLGYEIPPLNGGTSGFSFHLADNVFTFRKIGGDGRVLTVGELSAGDDVELFLTSANGLVQYRLGDCLRIRSTRPLLFEIAGRVGHGLNVATEKATLSQLTRAASRAGETSSTPVRHFFVCPGTSTGGRPCYEWTLMVDDPSALDRVAMLAELDRQMAAENDDYRDAREEATFLLDTPRLNVLDASVARRYFDRDSHRGQLKMKTAFNSRDALQAFLAEFGATIDAATGT